MVYVDLQHLTNLMARALASPSISHMVELSKKEIVKSEEPFMWKVLSERLIGETFPKGILSGWIFVLKPDMCTPSHQHPNSVQYSAITEGGGKIEIEGKKKEIQVFQIEGKRQAWYVIPKNVPHAVATRDRPNVVLSFHTCSIDQLVEVETSTGRCRFYKRH